MKFNELMDYIDVSDITKKIRQKRYNKSRLSRDDILKMREKINSEDYLNKAVSDMAYILTGEIITMEG